MRGGLVGFGGLVSLRRWLVGLLVCLCQRRRRDGGRGRWVLDGGGLLAKLVKLPWLGLPELGLELARYAAAVSGHTAALRLTKGGAPVSSSVGCWRWRRPLSFWSHVYSFPVRRLDVHVLV